MKIACNSIHLQSSSIHYVVPQIQQQDIPDWRDWLGQESPVYIPEPPGGTHHLHRLLQVSVVLTTLCMYLYIVVSSKWNGSPNSKILVIMSENITMTQAHNAHWAVMKMATPVWQRSVTCQPGYSLWYKWSPKVPCQQIAAKVQHVHVVPTVPNAPHCTCTYSYQRTRAKVVLSQVNSEYKQVHVLRIIKQTRCYFYAKKYPWRQQAGRQ